MQKRLTCTVRKEDRGITLGTLLKQRLFLTTRQLRTLKHYPGSLSVYDSDCVPFDTFFLKMALPPGSRIEICYPDEGPTVAPEEGRLEILYEDEDLVLINKPSGMACHPAGKLSSGTLANYLAARYPEPVRILGRLDKETSGILAACHSSLAYRRLELQHKAGRYQRIYYALVQGKVEGEGTIRTSLARQETALVGACGHPLSLMVPSSPGSSGQTYDCCTHYTVLRSSPRASLLRVSPETGRMHQIRAHMASIAHPLLGDGLYGGLKQIQTENGSTLDIPRTLLHAHALCLDQPFTGERLFVCCPLPADYAKIVRDLFD